MILPAELADELRLEAKRALPQECCGLLIGTIGRITRAIPSPNCHSEPERFFTIDPKVQFAALRSLRGHGAETVLGHYHSHPKGPAEPSPRDLDAANDPDLLWLVIDARNGRIGAFKPRADSAGRVVGFDPLTLEGCA